MTAVFLLVSADVSVRASEPVIAREAAAEVASTNKASIWKGKNGEALPFENNEEVKEFLRTAEILDMEILDEGVSGAKRVLLEKDGVQVRAVFRIIESFREVGPGLKGALRRNFVDHYIFEVAAYELSQMLGLDNVPPVVRRQISSDIGSLQIWVENAITENIRLEEERRPPNPLAFSRQYQVMKIFDNLICNDDRNLGNILYDENWKLWMIDHTRTFRLDLNLSEPEEIMSCEEGLWVELQALDEESLKERLDGLVRGSAIKALLARRDALVEHIRKLIERKGEQAALFKF